MPENTVVVAAAAALIIGIAIGYLSRRFLAASSVKRAEGYAEEVLEKLFHTNAEAFLDSVGVKWTSS